MDGDNLTYTMWRWCSIRDRSKPQATRAKGEKPNHI